MAAPINVSNEYDTGWVGGLAVGTQFDVGGLRPRAEIEVGYMRSEIDRHVIDGALSFDEPDAVGHTGVLYGLVNGYVDFGPGPLKPYVGAGIGVGHAEFQEQGVDSLGGTFMDDLGTGFAWQIGGGLSYSFNSPGDGRARLSLFQRGGCRTDGDRRNGIEHRRARPPGDGRFPLRLLVA